MFPVLARQLVPRDLLKAADQEVHAREHHPSQNAWTTVQLGQTGGNCMGSSAGVNIFFTCCSVSLNGKNALKKL